MLGDIAARCGRVRKRRRAGHDWVGREGRDGCTRGDLGKAVMGRRSDCSFDCSKGQSGTRRQAPQVATLQQSGWRWAAAPNCREAVLPVAATVGSRRCVSRFHKFPGAEGLPRCHADVGLQPREGERFRARLLRNSGRARRTLLHSACGARRTGSSPTGTDSFFCDARRSRLAGGSPGLLDPRPSGGAEATAGRHCRNLRRRAWRPTPGLVIASRFGAYFP